jgi:hypothetical protein
MSFVSKSQRRACYAKQNAAKKDGTTSSWNCAAWERNTPKNLPERKMAINSYPLFTKEQHDRLPKKDQNVLGNFIDTLVKRKTYIAVFYIVAFAVSFAVASTQAGADENPNVDFRYGRFFEWFTIIFIPAVTVINMMAQFPLSLGLNLGQLVTMIFVFVYYFRGKPHFTQEDYVNLYVTAVVWCLASVHGLANPFSVFNSTSTVFMDLGVLAIVVSGGVGLKFVRAT